MKWDIGPTYPRAGNAERALHRTITTAHECRRGLAAVQDERQHAVLPIAARPGATWGTRPGFLYTGPLRGSRRSRGCTTSTAVSYPQ